MSSLIWWVKTVCMPKKATVMDKHSKNKNINVGPETARESEEDIYTKRPTRSKKPKSIKTEDIDSCSEANLVEVLENGRASTLDNRYMNDTSRLD